MRAPNQWRFWLVCGAVLALARPAAAFGLEGTADFDVADDGEASAPFTVVTLAGFELSTAAGHSGQRLRLFAEYGPAQVLGGGVTRAGQLLIEVPELRLAPNRAVRLEATDYDVELVYEEWRSGGATTFEGLASHGWI
jgi:hypothetical protein